MRRIRFWAPVLLALAGAVSAQEAIAATAQALVQGDWSKRDSFGLSIDFEADGSFTASYGDMSESWDAAGVFEVKQGLFSLFAFGDGPGETKPFANGGRMMMNKNSLDYPYYLEVDLVDSSRFVYTVYDLSRPRQGGERVSIDGVPAACVGITRGSTTADVKCRDKPSLSGKIIQADAPDPETGQQVFIPYVPKGRMLRILARTLAKEKVQTWTNYWYYVEFEYVAGPPDPVRGWMFGEFVEIGI